MERDRGGRPRHPDILTPAEWHVLEELRKGGTNAEIAVRLGVSPDAVKYHISNMLGKLDVDDRRQLVAWRPERHGRLFGFLALPSVFTSVGRPLLWAGAALTGTAVVAVVAVVFLAAGGEEESGGSPPPARMATVNPTPSATTTTESTAAPNPALACGDPWSAPNLLMFSDGAATELVIEWTGGPADATGWQYRTRLWGAGTRDLRQGWGARRDDTTDWRDILTSVASTCSYRITGLMSRGAYEAQVRATVPGGPHGVESNVAEGVTQYDDGRSPSIGPDVIVKGDGSTRWRIHQFGWTIIIPDGMLVRGGGAAINGVSMVGIYDVETGSVLYFQRRWVRGLATRCAVASG